MAFDRAVVGKSFGPFLHRYDWQGPVLYALGCGASVEELDLLLENRGPKVLPSFSVVPALVPLKDGLARLGGNILTLVHGAQRCTLHRPIPPEGTLSTMVKVAALYDKGKGALAFFETTTVDEKQQKICDTEWQIFYRGEGGFGGERGPEAPSYNPPEDRAPDAHREMPTLLTQALLYRLGSQDLNPIHAVPEVAASVGFPKPILHGLCSFGHATRAVISASSGGDPDRLISIEGRFSKPVFPGDTIETDVWNIKPGEVYFRSSVKERKEPVISLGRATFKT